MMRASLPVALLCSALLSACASTREADLTSKHDFQPGPLKVHPGLLGMKVETAPAPTAALPASAKPAVVVPVAKVESAPAVAAPTPAAATTGMAVSKDLKAHLRAERSFYFDLDKSDLKAEYDPVLKAHASYLAEHPEAKVRIEGHADERGGREYNRQLGEKRAEIVRAELLVRGAPERQVGVKSYGEAKPRLKGHDEESWAENRRADVIYESE